MKWQGREESSNIEDRRGQGGPSGGGIGGGFGGGFGSGGGLSPFGQGGGLPIGGRGGVGGIVVIIIVLLACWALGINPLSLLDNGGDSSGSSGYSQSQPSSTADQQQLVDFVSVVVKDTETYWTDYFQKIGKSYTAPKIVLFSGATQSACGTAQTASGPFYCPDDKKVYLDLAFYDQLRQQFHAAGDFAQAYVVAHEVGHHVQDELGLLPKYDAQMQSSSQDQANAISVRIELQADCYAGAWANYEGKQNVLDDGDTAEAINAANQIGDDTLQRDAGQGVQPRNFTHGTSAQRMSWFKKGLASGDPKDCDTFSGGV
jgi:predicted metalloprotease